MVKRSGSDVEHSCHPAVGHEQRPRGSHIYYLQVLHQAFSITFTIIETPTDSPLTMSKYSSDPKWADVTPIPQDDGGPNPLAAISYTPGYAESMSYLRAVMAANEYSDRTLELTEDIIAMNPAHYTVWYVAPFSISSTVQTHR